MKKTFLNFFSNSKRLLKEDEFIVTIILLIFGIVLVYLSADKKADGIICGCLYFLSWILVGIFLFKDSTSSWQIFTFVFWSFGFLWPIMILVSGAV